MADPAADAPAAEREAKDHAVPAAMVASDPVAKKLAERGLVFRQHVAAALADARPNVPLWRRLLDQPGVNRAAAMEIVADVAGWTPLDLSAGHPSLEFVQAVTALFPKEVPQRMATLGLLPFEFGTDPQRGIQRLILATADPEDNAQRTFMHGLGVAFELRYARSAELQQRIAETLLAHDGVAQPIPVDDGVAFAAPVDDYGRGDGHGDGYARGDGHAHGDGYAHGDGLGDGFAAQEPEPATDRAPAAEAPGSAEAPPGRSDLDDSLAAILARAEELARFSPKAPSPPPAPTPVVEPPLPPPPPSVVDDERPAYVALAASSDAAEVPVVLPEAVAETLPVPGVPDELPAPEPVADEEAPPRASAKDSERVQTRDRVVQTLQRKRLVTSEQVKEALAIHGRDGGRETLWRILCSIKGVNREAVFAEAASVYAFPTAEIGDGRPDPEMVRSVMSSFPDDKRDRLLDLKVMPYAVELDPATKGVKLVLVTHDPTRPDVHRLLQTLKLERFEVQYASESAVSGVLDTAFPRRNEYLDKMAEGGGIAFDLGASFEQGRKGLIDEDALEAEIGKSTLINLLEAALVEAVRQGVSDIHIFPNAQRQTEIHFRGDGKLRLWHLEDKVHPESLLAVIKDNSTNVDRFERDMAQDGFIQRKVDGALIRFRVSVLPIANAAQDVRSESIVIRILDDRKVVTDLNKLGLNHVALDRFNLAIRQPHGMVILTGPTGSGKSTTLVAALSAVVTPEVNVLTVEDPVEYIIPGVRQIKLSHKLGLEGALRAILRHDPDVVMVGEMRDKETAELAIKLANTGHLTFSTLHTNDAPSAVSRLYKMGVEPFLIAYAINLIVAQRLIRLLCPTCKVKDPEPPDPVLLERAGFSKEEVASTEFHVAGHDKNCRTCKGLGYKGRKAINEALYFTQAIRHIVVESDGMVDEEAIRNQALKEGMLTLSGSAKLLVMSGETSVEEMVRTTASEGH